MYWLSTLAKTVKFVLLSAQGVMLHMPKVIASFA